MIPGRHVTLVLPAPEHYAALEGMLNDAETMQHLRFMGKGPGNWTKSDIEARYREPQGLTLVIVDKNSGAVAGSCGFNSFDRARAASDLGIIVHRRYWGTVVVPDALLALLDHGFGTLALRQIDFVTHGDNLRMRRILESLGLPCLEAIDTVIDDIPVPGHTYRLTDEHWPEARRRLEARRLRRPVL